MYGLLARVLGLLGGGILAVGLAIARRALASRHWPETTGKITAVNVERIWLGRGSLHFPDVRYEYRVNDTQFVGQRIGFVARLPLLSYGAALYVLQHEYPRGRVVPVRYNPLNSQDAVLEPGIRTGLRTIIGVGILLIVLAAASYLRFLALA